LKGRCLHIISDDIRTDSDKFFSYLSINQINSAYIPPFFLKNFYEWLIEKCNSVSLSYLLVGVEPIEKETLFSISDYLPNLRIVNGYGPTESTIVTTSYIFNPKQKMTDIHNVPIGKPIYNSQAYILDKNLNLLPIGCIGEIYLGGAGLARGYYVQPILTAEKFIPNYFSQNGGDRLYKTGDLGRYLSNGNIEFVGRVDDQIKIRGFRVELGEIKSVLKNVDTAEEVIVLTHENDVNKKIIVAYIVSQKPGEELAKSCREICKKKLPKYMFPSQFVLLKALPLTHNGKIDHKTLAISFLNKSIIAYEAPEGELEKQLALIWSELLGIEKIGRRDDFFDLGGDSIIAMQVVHRAKQIGLSIDGRDIFKTPTIAELIESTKNVLFYEIADTEN